MRCAACGYAFDTHELGTRKCHPLTGDKNGRRGTWREPAPIVDIGWREIMRREARQRAADYAAEHAPYEPPVVLPPQVPARAPNGPEELASYQGKQAVGLGRRAVAAGWQVRALYARAGNGTELCCIKLRKGVYRAVATWTRKPGNVGARLGWGADLAYAWQTDINRGPIKLNHTELEGIFHV